MLPSYAFLSLVVRLLDHRFSWPFFTCRTYKADIIAGNIGSAASEADPITLETPTLKGEVYTTGRGGSGNIAKNNNPEATRRI
jgi:hypothetical protein